MGSHRIWMLQNSTLSYQEMLLKLKMIIKCMPICFLRIVTVILVVISVVWIPILQSANSGQLYVYIQSVTSFLAPPVTAIFVMAVFWKRTNEAVMHTQKITINTVRGLSYILTYWQSHAFEEATSLSWRRNVLLFYCIGLVRVCVFVCSKNTQRVCTCLNDSKRELSLLSDFQLSLVSDWDDRYPYFLEKKSHLNISHYIVVLMTHCKVCFWEAKIIDNSNMYKLHITFTFSTKFPFAYEWSSVLFVSIIMLWWK